jgi:hypothetical protein
MKAKGTLTVLLAIALLSISPCSSACDISCQAQQLTACSSSMASCRCPMLQLHHMHDRCGMTCGQKPVAAIPRTEFHFAAPLDVQAGILFLPAVPTSTSAFIFRWKSPPQNSSGFNPLQVSLKI